MTPLGDARHRKLAIIAWLTICVVWGTTYLAIRVSLETIPVALLAGFRWATAGVLMTALLRLFGERLPPRTEWGSIAVIAFLMHVVGNGMVVWAQQHVPSGLTAVIIAMVPFWAVFVEAWLPRGERLTRQSFVGLLVGFAGIVILLWPQITVGGREGRMFVAGALALQCACLAWSLATSYSKRRSLKVNPFASAALQMLFSGAAFLLIGTLLGNWQQLSFTPRTVGGILYLIVFGSMIGFSAYFYALKYLPVSTVSLYAYVNPVIAVVLGTLVLGEPFSLRIVVAAMFVFGGIAIVRSQATAKTVAAPVQKAVA